MSAMAACALPAAKSLDQCRLDTWGIRDGLPGYDITSLAQTPDGFIWLGTTQGLLRFDGATFTQFNHRNVPGLTNDTIRSLAVTKSGSLWVGAEWCGYGRLVDGVYVRRPYPDSQWNATQYFHQSPDGTFWVGYERWGFIGRDRAGTLQMLPSGTGMYLDGIVDFPNGSVLASSLYGGLFRIAPAGKVSPFQTDPAFPVTDIIAMVRTPDKSIWCASQSKGLYRIQGRRWTHYSTANGLASDALTCLFVDHEGRLWIGTDNGVDTPGAHGFDHFNAAHGLAADDVTAITEDKEGNLWVATGIYLNRFANTRLTPIGIGSHLTDQILGLTVERDGNIYFGTRSGLWREPESMTGVPSRMTTWQVNMAILARNGDLVAFWSPGATDRVIGRLHAGKWTTTPVDFTPKAMFDTGNGIEAFGIIGQYLRLPQDKETQLPFLHNQQEIYDVKADTRGVLWMATDVGLVRWDHGRYTIMQVGLPEGTHVLSIDISDPGHMWLGTDHGLVRVDESALDWDSAAQSHVRATIYTTADGLPSNECLQLLRDNAGTLWVGGYFGILAIKPGDLIALDHHNVAALPFKLYTAADGIRNYPIVAIPAKTPSGLLLFLGMRGITLADPAHLVHNLLPPQVAIEDAVANGVSLSPAGRNRVRPGHGSVTIHYAGLSYVEPEEVRFRYRLEGEDAGWIDAGTRRVASYTNLPPGHYSFQVIACNNDGVWNDVGAAISFELEPHFYETIWFRGLMGLAGLFGLLLVIRLRTRAVVQRARALEDKVVERTSELLRANTELTSAKVEIEHQNVQLQASQAEVEAQNHELRAMQTELETHNEDLQAMQAQLEAQNDELQTVQALLEAQNQELIETQDFLAQANARLEALATTDGLTGLYNHRTFHDFLNQEWSRRTRYGITLSIILMDVDLFKQFNDSHGHPAGDEVLRTVSRILKSTVRESDIVARYGGEEFVVICPQTDAPSARQLAERLRAALQSFDWPLRTVTGSFGVSTADVTTDEPSDLVLQADSALYRSKHSGRNQVTHFLDTEMAALSDQPPVLAS